MKGIHIRERVYQRVRCSRHYGSAKDCYQLTNIKIRVGFMTAETCLIIQLHDELLTTGRNLWACNGLMRLDKS